MSQGRKPGSHGQGIHQSGDTHWSFLAPGGITPLMTLMTALPTPGKPAVKSTHAVTVVSPSLHPHTQKCRCEATAAGPQGDGGAEPCGAPRSCVSSVLSRLGVLSVHPQEEMLRFMSSCRHSVVHRKMQPTGQVSRAGKTSISAQMSTVSTELILRLITMNKPPLE